MRLYASWIKFFSIVFVSGTLFFLHTTIVAAYNCTSTASGNWDSADTWGNCGGSAPSASDTAEIASPDTVTITQSTTPSILSLLIQLGASIAFAGQISQDANTSLTTTQGFSSSGTIEGMGQLVASGGTVATTSTGSIGSDVLLVLNGGAVGTDNDDSGFLASAAKVGSGVTFTVDGSHTAKFGTLTNLGTISIDSGSTLNVTTSVDNQYRIGGNGTLYLPADVTLTAGRIGYEPLGTLTMYAELENTDVKIYQGDSGYQINYSYSPKIKFYYNGSSADFTLTGGIFKYTGGVYYAKEFEMNTSSVSKKVSVPGFTVETAGTLTTGKLHPYSSPLVVASGATITATSGTSYVVGEGTLQTVSSGTSTATYALGDAAGNFITMAVTFSSISTGGTVQVKPVLSTHAQSATAGLTYLMSSKYWTVTSSGGLTLGNGTYAVAITYPQSLIPSSTTLASMQMNKYSGEWATPLGSTVSLSGSRAKTTATGFTSFSDFVLGGDGDPAPVPEFTPFAYMLTLAGAGWFLYQHLQKNRMSMGA